MSDTITIKQLSNMYNCSRGTIYYHADKLKININNIGFKLNDSNTQELIKRLKNRCKTHDRVVFDKHMEGRQSYGQGHVVCGVPYEIRDKFYELCKKNNSNASHVVSKFILKCLDDNEVPK